MKHDLHPACALWPRMSEAELTALAKDIGERGLIEPIMLYEAKILDGRNREEACERAGVAPRYKVYEGNEPIGFSISANLHRRHLSKAELSFIAESLATLKQGRPSAEDNKGSRENLLLQTVATQMGVGRSNVESVRVLKNVGEPNVIEMARSGKVGVQSAAAYARNTSREEQRNATPMAVRDKGNAFKKGSGSIGARKGSLIPLNKPRSQGPRKPEKGERIVSIPLNDLTDRLVPLIECIKEQSNRNSATVSFTVLKLYAACLQSLFNEWTGNGHVLKSWPALRAMSFREELEERKRNE